MVMRLGLELDTLVYTHDIYGVETDAAWRDLALRFVYYISSVSCQNFQFQKSSSKFSGLRADSTISVSDLRNLNKE